MERLGVYVPAICEEKPTSLICLKKKLSFTEIIDKVISYVNRFIGAIGQLFKERELKYVGCICTPCSKKSLKPIEDYDDAADGYQAVYLNKR